MNKDDEEIKKTSQELIRELQSPAEMTSRPVPMNSALSELIETRVREKYYDGKAEFELGQHVHAIMKFFKGVK